LISFATGLAICSVVWLVESLFSLFNVHSETNTAMYAMWLTVAPTMNLFRPEIRKRFWKQLLRALAGACVGMMIVIACLGVGPITLIRWLGAVMGNMVGLYCVLPILLEIGRFTEQGDATKTQMRQNLD
jgi:hypothetical protein